MKKIFLLFLLFCSNALAQTYGVNFTRITAPEWQSYTAGSQPVAAEQAPKAFDNQNGSKWLGLRSQGAWVIVQLVTDGTYSPTRAVQKIQFVTANDDAGRDPTGYRIQGSTNGVDWVNIKEESISLSSNRFTASSIYNLNNLNPYSYYRVEFTGVKSGGDMFQIAEIRLLYDIDDPQGTLASGATSSPTAVYSSGITITQQTRKTSNQSLATGHNAQIDIAGDDNIVSVQQIGTGHFVQIDVTGNVNNINVLQTSTTTARHYLEATVSGSNNTANLTQRDTAKTAFIEINGNANIITTNQKDTGNHYLNLSVTGNNHSATVVQEGAGSHAATVQLNGTQPWNFNLNQSGSTNKTYSLPHSMTDGSTVSGTCSAIGGCNLTVNQQ